MSFAKREMGRRQHQRDVAEGIALDAKVLAKCPIHEEVHYTLNDNHKDAYKLANRLFTSREPPRAPAVMVDLAMFWWP